jgi:alpha-glucuronidase
MQREWSTLQGKVDDERYQQVQAALVIQEREARWWRDASIQYFRSLSRLPIPPRYEQPARPLDFFLRVRCPADPRRPRCDAVR